MKNYFKHKMREKSPMAIVGMIIFGIIAVIGLAVLFGYVVMLLWNWLMPEIFGLTIITFWQAVGLVILSKLFFGGFGSDSGSKKGKKHDYKCEDKKHKKDFSKWELYDQFWKEEGDEAFNSFVEKSNNKSEDIQPANE